MDVEKILKIAIPLGISAVFLGILFKGGFKPPAEGVEITEIKVD